MSFVYLVRHGEAKSESEDPARPLNATGRAMAERVAMWFAQAHFPVDEIRHSGKARAEQTAAIFGRHLAGLESRAASGLSPNDDVGPVAAELNSESRSVMLVGHLPFLSLLAGQLLAGTGRPLVQFETAGLAVLERNDDEWSVVTVVSPADV